MWKWNNRNLLVLLKEKCIYYNEYSTKNTVSIQFSLCRFSPTTDSVNWIESFLILAPYKPLFAPNLIKHCFLKVIYVYIYKAFFFKIVTHCFFTEIHLFYIFDDLIDRSLTCQWVATHSLGTTAIYNCEKSSSNCTAQSSVYNNLVLVKSEFSWNYLSVIEYLITHLIVILKSWWCNYVPWPFI